MNPESPGSSEPSAAKAAMFPLKSTLLGDVVAKLLGVVTGFLSPGLLESSLGASKRLGHYTVLVGAALTLIYSLIVAIKMEAFQLVVTGLLFVGVIAVAQFAAARFLDSAARLIANSPSRVSSGVFFECTGLLVIIFAISVLLGGFGAAFAMRSAAPLVPALVGVGLLLSFATIMLHPGMVIVATGEGTAGEEAIGIFATFAKAKLMLAPVVFFLFAILGALIVFAGFFGDRFAASFAQFVPINIGYLPFGFVGAALIVVACLVPLIVYFFFLLQYLFLDVLRAILAVPGKLDELKR